MYLPLPAPHLGDFLSALYRLGLEDRGLRLELSLAGQVQRRLVGRRLGCVAQDLFGEVQLPALLFGPEAFDGCEQGVVFCLKVAVGRLRRGVVDAHQDFVLFDDVALAHQNLCQDTAFQVLDDLGLA